jgi:hypothetical protein
VAGVEPVLERLPGSMTARRAARHARFIEAFESGKQVLGDVAGRKCFGAPRRLEGEVFAPCREERDLKRVRSFLRTFECVLSSVLCNFGGAA